MRWEDTTGHASVVPGYRDDPTVLDGGAGEYSIAVIDPAQPASQPASQPARAVYLFGYCDNIMHNNR
jgi:hypothetical protein